MLIPIKNRSNSVKYRRLGTYTWIIVLESPTSAPSPMVRESYPISKSNSSKLIWITCGYIYWIKVNFQIFNRISEVMISLVDITCKMRWDEIKWDKIELNWSCRTLLNSIEYVTCGRLQSKQSELGKLCFCTI